MKLLEHAELLSLDCADLPWQASTFAAGMSVKNVAIAGAFEMQIVRMQAGARIPPHTHDLPEFIYVLAGDLHIAGRILTTGCASIAAPGSQHLNVHSEGGCTFVLVDRAL